MRGSPASEKGVPSEEIYFAFAVGALVFSAELCPASEGISYRVHHGLHGRCIMSHDLRHEHGRRGYVHFVGNIFRDRAI